jgi:hypothetical protein
MKALGLSGPKLQPQMLMDWQGAAVNCLRIGGLDAEAAAWQRTGESEVALIKAMLARGTYRPRNLPLPNNWTSALRPGNTR